MMSVYYWNFIVMIFVCAFNFLKLYDMIFYITKQEIRSIIKYKISEFLILNKFTNHY